MVEYIVEAAARVFDREGIEATTNRIAAEAGVSIGSLYQYFGDKHAILHELAMRHLDDVDDAFGTALAEPSGSVRELVVRLVDAAAALHSEHGGLHRVMREHTPRSPEVVARFDEVTGRITERIEKELEDLGTGDARGRAAIALATVDAHVHGVLTETGDTETREQRIALVVDQVVAALAPGT